MFFFEKKNTLPFAARRLNSTGRGFQSDIRLSGDNKGEFFSQEPFARWRILNFDNMEVHMRGGLLWLLGIPIPVIILLYVFHVI